ncbi:MAG: DUF167 domain-containing protein [Asgard group archaeon]|nr:DUF167 domain-containing protein [Asgard group archaeon]
MIMKLYVKPNSQTQKIVYDSIDKNLTVFLKSPPDKGKANKELIKFLAKYLDISSSEISIISGHTSREKILMLDLETITSIKAKLIENEK